MPTHPRADPAPEPVPAALLGDRGVFVWQKALHVAGTDLPEAVRYTLCVLALYMNPDGTQGRPGYGRFALARGKSDRTVRTHLDKASEAGWVRCVQRGGRAGDGTTRASVYEATIPAGVFARLAEVLEPAWGSDGPSQQETQGLPVDVPEETPQPEAQGLPVEDAPQAEAHGLPVEGVSTGSSGVSTGSSGLPPTDHVHRPDEIKIDQRVRAEQIVRDATDAADDEIDPFLTWLTSRYPPRSSLPAYLARMVQRGHLQGRVDQWRGTLAAPPAEPRPDRPAQEGAACPCGIPGGADLTSQGLPKCAICRRHLRTCTADPVYCTPCQDIRQAAGLPLDPRSPGGQAPASPPNVIPLSPRPKRQPSPSVAADLAEPT